MSDALPMPGKAVSPNTITLKDGYTWEVGRTWMSRGWMHITKSYLDMAQGVYMLCSELRIT
jgi:hypothetical protein